MNTNRQFITIVRKCTITPRKMQRIPAIHIQYAFELGCQRIVTIGDEICFGRVSPHRANRQRV